MKTATIRNRSDDVVEVLIYDPIGGDGFFGGGIGAREFREQIKGLKKGQTLNLRINSPGGSVTEGAAMLTALDEYKGRIEVDVDGIAASAASVVAMAGDHIRVASNGLMMVHNPVAMAMGGADDMRRTADLLDKVREQIIDAYQRQSKASRAQIAAWMAAETWFDGREAVEAGLAHEASGPVRVAALAGHRALLSRLNYRHAPAALMAEGGNPLAVAVGDYVQWLVEDPGALYAELEDGMVEEVSEGTLFIPGTSLSLKGSPEDPALRICDLDDEDESYWYLVRASQVRKVGGDEEDEPMTPGMGGGMGAKAGDWDGTWERDAALAKLTQAGGGAATPSPFRAG